MLFCFSLFVFRCSFFSLFVFRFSTFGQADYQVLNVKNLVWHCSRCRISSSESRVRINQVSNVKMLFWFSLFVFHYSFFVIRFSTFEKADYRILNVKNLVWHSSRCPISSPNITSFECQNAIMFVVIRFSLFVYRCSFFDIRTQTDYQVFIVKI